MPRAVAKDVVDAVESELRTSAIAAKLRVSQGRASQLAALRKLEPHQRAAVWDGRLSTHKGRQLAQLDPGPRAAIFVDMLKDPAKWTRKNLTEKASLVKANKATAEQVINDPNIQQLEKELSELLATPVTIAHTAKGGGKLSIQYFSNDELDGILAVIRAGKGG